jgi:hypothetical protein
MWVPAGLENVQRCLGRLNPEVQREALREDADNAHILGETRPKASPPVNDHFHQNPDEVELLSYYFKEENAVLPVVNEPEFWEWYRNGRRYSSNLCGPLLLKTMILSVLAYTQDDDEKTFASSLFPEDSRLFDDICTSYGKLSHFHPTDIRLVQTALLLSRWHISNQSVRNSNYWVCEALRIALHTRLCDGRSPSDMTLWCCCITQSIFSALYLRRQSLIDRVVQVFEATSFNMADLIHKIRDTTKDSLILLLELIGIIREILVLPHQSTALKATPYPPFLLIDLAQVVKIDGRLSAWANRMEETLSRSQTMRGGMWLEKHALSLSILRL